MANQNNTIVSCLMVAVIFLAFYLLFTSWCTKKDHYVQQSIKGLQSAYGYNYASMEDVDRQADGGEEFEGTTIYDIANDDALDYYCNFKTDTSRIERTSQYHEMMINKYNKDLRYC